MKYFYKIDPKAEKLILFFDGWSMDQTAIEHLELPDSTDLICCYDYRDILFNPQCDFTKYRQIDLVAWSMGVWGAETVAINKQLPELTSATAIAGTPIPMHDKLGIPRRMFIATLKGISEENRKRFNLRMCGGKAHRHLLKSLESRTTQEVRDELDTVRQASMKLQGEDFIPSNLDWTKAIVPEKDFIIPPENQIYYWQSHQIPFIKIEGAEHYVFSNYHKWSDIIPSKD